MESQNEQIETSLQAVTEELPTETDPGPVPGEAETLSGTEE